MLLDSVSKKRNVNIELLRIISMLMVTILHALTKSELLVSLAENTTLNGWVVWILEVLSVGAVNIFMLISGYVLIASQFKMRRLIEIVCQAIFYSLGTFLVYCMLGQTQSVPVDIYSVLNYIFPIHMEVYWFITCYVVLYMLLPVIVNGVKAISEKQLATTILCLLVYECGFKSFLPFKLVSDEKGYSFLWYLIMFLIGAYFKLYGFRFIDSVRKGWLVYLAGSFMVLAEVYVIQQFHIRTGRLAEMLFVSTNYNHLFVVISAVGIFAAFIHMKASEGAWGKVVCILSPMTLGVYLFQENLILRYEWQNWFGLRDSFAQPLSLFVSRIFLAVVTMFFAGIITDAFRTLLFRAVERILQSCREGKR